MSNTEKIAAIFISILLFLVIVLTLKLLNARESIGEDERTLNRLHNSQIAMYNTQILSLNGLIEQLEHEIDSLENAKQRVRIVTIHEIDSIRALPFDGRAFFWSIETTRIDSIRSRYVSRNN